MGKAFHAGFSSFMMSLGKFICTAAALTIATQAQAVSVQSTTARAEVVIPNLPPHEVANHLQEAMSGWLEKVPMRLKPLPNPIPSRPGAPKEIQEYVAGVGVPVMDCQSAYAEVLKKPAPYKNSMVVQGELLQACIYPFEKGNKIYLTGTTLQASYALTSGLFSGIKNAVRGSDSEFLTKWLNELIGKLNEKAPGVLVERIESPGLPVQQPDQAAVQALLPPMSQASDPIATEATQSADISQANAIDARKNLTAMGLTYHNQEQFIAAIRRKDDLAVKLYMEAGGVDPAVRDASGKTALEIAKASGAEKIVRILQGQSLPPASTRPAPIQGNLAPGFLSPEQQEQFRQQIMQQIRQQM